MNYKKDEHHYRFCISILHRLDLNGQDFFTRLANEEAYETLVMQWIDYCYTTKMHFTESIRYIFRVRYQYFFEGVNTFPKSQPPAKKTSTKRDAVLVAS